MNLIPNYAELYTLIASQEIVPDEWAEPLRYAKRMIDAEQAIDRLYDTIFPDDSYYFTAALRWKCKNTLKHLYRFLLSNALRTDDGESLVICQSDLAGVFGYHEHTMVAARNFYDLLIESNIIRPAHKAPTRNTEELVWLLPPEKWCRPENPGRHVL